MSPRVSIKIDKFFLHDNVEEFKFLIETLNINPLETLSGDPSVFSPVLDNTDDKNLLTYACLLGKINIVKYLINLNVYSSLDNELYVACYKGNTNIIDYIVLHGVVIDSESIFYAAMGNQLQVLRYLISVCKKLTDYAIEKCLESPIKNGHLEIVKELLYHYKGKKINDLVILAIPGGHLKVIEYMYPFIDHSVHTDFLSDSVEYNKIDIVKFFVNRGTKYTYFCRDAIWIAANNNHIDILSFLIESTDEPIDYRSWKYDYQAIETLKKYIQIKESLFKGTLTEQTETECCVCYERMKVRQGLVQCKRCKKCVHKECQQKWEYTCVYCRTEF